jgi:hypothetical protein
MEVTCPLGFGTAALHSVPIDATGTEIGMDHVDMFDCNARTGTSASLAPGPYRSWIEITNAGMTDVFATSLPAIVDVTEEDRGFTTHILDDGGYFKMSWKLVGETSGMELTCDQAGATNGIDVVATETSNQDNSASDHFECVDFEGVTAGYVAASYRVSVSALGPGEEPVGSAPDLADQVIEAPNAITDLGPLTISIADR